MHLSRKIQVSFIGYFRGSTTKCDLVMNNLFETFNSYIIQGLRICLSC